MLTTGRKGLHPTPTRVTLVATHADQLNASLLNDVKHRVSDMTLSLKERFSLTVCISMNICSLFIHSSLFSLYTYSWISALNLFSWMRSWL